MSISNIALPKGSDNSHKITKISFKDKDYPPLLAQLPDPPPVIYARGNLTLLQETKLTLALVGTRKATAYGLSVTENLSEEAGQAGLIIVSGLARGIDTAAHQGCLAGGGKTVAVLGTGLDEASIYPRENKPLATRIVNEQGLLISEYPPQTTAQKFHFPARNRLIAGLARAVAVMEAPLKSGALITASLATDYNRELLALPGPIISLNSLGPNQLISQGATPILGMETIFEIFDLKKDQLNEHLGGQFTDQENLIIKILQGASGLRMENLIEQSGLSPAQTTEAISNLELKNIIGRDLAGRLSLKKFDS